MNSLLKRGIIWSLFILFFTLEGQAYNIDGYPSYWGYVDELESLESAHPNLCRMENIGSGYRGYPTSSAHPIWAMKVSNQPDEDKDVPAVLFSGLHHAKEPTSIEAVMRFLEYLLNNYGSDAEVTSWVDSLEIWFVPMINPDGYIYLRDIAPTAPYWRKTMRDNDNDGYYDYNYDGVDPNRNYPYNWSLYGSTYPGDEDYRGPWAGSEGEVQTYMALALREKFLYSFTYHTHANTMDYCWGLNGWEIAETSMLNTHFGHLASLVPAVGGGTVTLRGSDGMAGLSYNWMFAVAGVLEGQVEIGDSFVPPYSTTLYYADQQRESQKELLRQAMHSPGIRGHVRDAATGEPLDATVRILEYYTPLYMGTRTTKSTFGQYYRRTSNNTYTVEAYAPGYEVQRATVTVEDDDWSDLDFDLVRGVPSEYSHSFSEGWEGWEPSSGNWEVLGGIMRHISTYGENRAVGFWPYAWSDFAFQANVRIDNGAKAGLWFRGPTGTSNSYAFYLRLDDNSVRLIKNVGHETYVVASTEVTAGTLEVGQWYLLRVETSGNRIRCFVDSQEFIDVVDSGDWIFTSGKLGFWANETMASFDNVLVTDVEEPGVPENLAAYPGDHTILLDWDDNTELDLAGYTVYHSADGETSWSPLNAAPITESWYRTDILPNGTSGWFRVTAGDFAGHESAPSDTVSMTPRDQPVIMVVDDDNRFDHESYLTDALEAGSYIWHEFDTDAESRSPRLSEMRGHDLVIWFCGDDGLDDYLWNGIDQDNEELKTWLDEGGRLWVIGLDFLYDRYGAAPDTFTAGDFCHDYLGISEYSVQSWSDDGSTGVTQLDRGNNVTWTNLDPITWTTTSGYLKYVDGCQTVAEADPVFVMGPESYSLAGYPAMVSFQNDSFTTLSSFFNLRYVSSETNRQELVDDVVRWFQSLSVIPEPVTVTIQLLETGIRLSWEAVPGATGYRVFSDSDPLGEFTSLVAELPGTDVSWDFPSDPHSTEPTYFRITTVVE